MNTQSKPLMTLGIVAFNQREYIQQAIDSALAQTYSPLEIILSDDCSTDDTFEIIQAAVRQYRGPHRVIANRTPGNQCILGHVLNICDRASGEMLVLAAGDDISHPRRVEKIAAQWQAHRPTAVFSNYELVDEACRRIHADYAPDKPSPLFEQVFNQRGQNIHGASSAYDRNFMRSLPRPTGRFYFEDIFMTFMIYLHGGTIRKIDEPLVQYRQHDSSITNASNARSQMFSAIKRRQLKSAEYEQNKQQLYAFFEEVLAQTPDNGRANIAALHAHAVQAGIRANWISMGTGERLATLLRDASHETRSWLAPRVFGLNTFAAMRQLKAFAMDRVRNKSPHATS